MRYYAEYMLLFTLKKWFFDMWDAVLKLLLMNVLGIMAIIVPLSIPGWLVNAGMPPYVVALSFPVGIALIIIYISATTHVAYLTATYKPWGLPELLEGIRLLFLRTLYFVLVNIAVGLLLYNALPFYFDMENLFGLAAASVLFWIAVLWIMTAQYNLPLYCAMKDPFLKTWKKSLIMALDNVFFSIIMAILLGGTIILSGFTAYLFPGIFGVILLLQVAVRLRLQKYDYLEENPEANRKRIPWRAVLHEDQQKVGKRTLRNMIFPWKD